jgi:tetratricopeptide (TPR) repeat protein
MASEKPNWPILNEPFKPFNINKPLKLEESVPLEKEIEKPSAGSRLKEAVSLYQAEEWKNALTELLRIDGESLSDKGQLELAYYLGLSYAKLERFNEALPHFDKVIAKENDPLRIYQCRMTLAYIYVTTKREKQAEFELRQLEKSGFESASMYNTLAYAAYAQKRLKDAIELYEKALELDENNATAMNSMGYILVDSGINPLKGLRLCNKALERKPRSAAYLDSLGWAYYKCGDASQARSLLAKAMEIAPKEREIREHFKVINGGAV